MHKPDPLIGSEKRPTLEPLTESFGYTVGVSKHRPNGKIKPLNDKLTYVTGSCQVTIKQEQLMSEAVI